MQLFGFFFVKKSLALLRFNVRAPSFLRTCSFLGSVLNIVYGLLTCLPLALVDMGLFFFSDFTSSGLLVWFSDVASSACFGLPLSGQTPSCGCL